MQLGLTDCLHPTSLLLTHYLRDYLLDYLLYLLLECHLLTTYFLLTLHASYYFFHYCFILHGLLDMLYLRHFDDALLHPNVLRMHRALS